VFESLRDLERSSELIQKLRYVYGRFVAVAVAFITTYSVLAWALIYRTRLIDLDETLTTYWLPVGLAWIPALLWILPRLKLLKLEMRDGRVRDLYLFAAAAAMIVPTVAGQQYLSKASAQVTRLGEITEIDLAPLTKYYVVDRPCLRNRSPRVHWSAERERRNGTATFTLSVVVPFCGSRGAPVSGASDEHASSAPPAWLGLTFRDFIREDGPDAQKEDELRRAIAKRAQDSLRTTDLGAFTYLELVGPGETRRRFEAAIEKVAPAPPDTVVLVPHHEPLDERTGDVGLWALGTFAGGAALWLVLLLFPRLDGERLRVFQAARDGVRPAEGRAWRRRLRSNNALGTTAIAVANAGVFLAMVLSGLGVVRFQREDLLKWGALSRPLLEGAGLLRLVSYQFVHGGLAHLVNNLYGLLFAGIVLEGIVGRGRLILAYAIAGVLGGAASALVHPAGLTVGASGSIFGLFGVLLGLVALKDARVASLRTFILANCTIYVGLNLLVGAVSPGVDNAAHVGGLVGGLIMSWPYRSARGRLLGSPDEP
jgi:membrane associated rhomboid family serine protease